MRQVPLKSASWQRLLPFFFVIVFDIMSINIVAPVLAPLVNNPDSALFGAQASAFSRHLLYGFIQALGPLCYAVGAPVLGVVSDKVGRRRVLLICVLGSLIGLIFYVAGFIAVNLSILILGRLIAGFTSGSLAVAQSAIADVSTGAEKAKNIGVIAVAMTIGLISGPLLGGVFSDPSVVSWFSNTTPFYVAIILSLVNLMILLVMLRETHTAASQKVGNIFPALTQLFFGSGIGWVLLSFFIFEFGWSLYYQSLALLLTQSFHVSNKVIGFFASYIGLLLSLFLLVGVRVALKYVALTKVVKPSLILGAIVLLLGFFTQSIVWQWLMAIPISLAVALCYSVLITMGSDKIDAHLQGLFMGTCDALLSIAFAITAFLGGVLSVHNARLPQLMAGCVFIIGALVFMLANKQYEG